MTHSWRCGTILLIWGLFLLVAPKAVLAQTNTNPLPPLNAAEVADDGSVYVLDAGQRLYELDPQTLAPVSVSARLAPVFSGGAAQIAADADRLYVRSDQLDGIHVLDRPSLEETEFVLIDAAALAVEAGKRLFVIERQPSPMAAGLYSFAVVTLPLDDLQAEPQPFGPTAMQPFGSLDDLVVDDEQRLLYVGNRDTSGSPNRHYQTYRAYDLDSGDEVDVGLERQSASTALRPVFTGSGTAAVSFSWQGIYPQQDRIYLLNRDAEPRTVEGVSGRLAIDAAGHWLYVMRERGLWVLEDYRDADYFLLRSVIPFLQGPPVDVRLSPDGETLYLFGNGWLTALATADLQVTGIEAISPFPNAWTSRTSADPQTARLFTAADGGEVALLNLQPSNEWYRSGSQGSTWQLLAAVLHPRNLGLDRLSLSPTLQTDGVIAGRGYWGEDQRTLWRTQDGGMNWSEWTPPITYVAGGEGVRTLYVADTPDPREAPSADPQPVPVGGSSENPAWSPGWTHLAFQNNISGDWEIYRVAADCHGAVEGPSAAAQECDVQQLTDSAGDDLLPAWSPDGRTIAFVSLRDGNPEIYAMSADGTQQTRLTFAPGGDWRPAWLPDSRHLVFTSDRNGNNDIFLLELPRTLDNESTREPSITPVIAGPADERDPAVSGDGELLYLSDETGVIQPYAADLSSFLASSSRAPISGSPILQDVTESIGHPGWQPNGDLLFTAGGGIYTARRYASPDDWQEMAASEDDALHPAGGATWYWLEPWQSP